MIVWLKAVHIISMAVWCGGLVALPAMLWKRKDLVGGPLYQLQHATRFVFVTVISPLAFIAIGTGTVLIFARETFTIWFAVKLGLIGILAKLHIGVGSAVIEVFKDEGTYSRFKMGLHTATGCLVVSGILVVVLSKPAFDLAELPAGLSRPGALGKFATRLYESSPITIPMP